MDIPCHDGMTRLALKKNVNGRYFLSGRVYTNTGITFNQYRDMVQGNLVLSWSCRNCTNQIPMEVVNSTAITDAPHPELSMSDIEQYSFRSPSTTIQLPPTPTTVEDNIQDLPENRIPDQTFDISNRNISRAPVIQDEDMADIPVDDVLSQESQVTYNIVENSTKRGGQKLVSTEGFAFTKRREGKNGFTYWICSKRSKSFRCNAWVKQYGSTFVACSSGHQHPPDPRLCATVKVSAKVKLIAKEHIHEPAGQIVDRVMREIRSQPDHMLPNPTGLVRVVNRHRQNLRPADPHDLEFEINREFICADEFLVEDVRVDNQRHLIFATNTQKAHLQRARRWFMDGTFKVVSRPFYQLSSIHAFIKCEDSFKQVPLCFILMSRRQKKDYVEVLNAIKNWLDEPLVEWMMMDFEAAAWQAVREVFGRIILKGCVFHWTQGVYRKVIRLGLGPSYNERTDKYAFIRKLMALPFLPSEHVRSAFLGLEEQILESNCQPILDLVQYVSTTWMNSSVWCPENWSVFRETVRTNNDVEGWHRRLNGRAGGSSLPFYVLVPILYGEAQNVELNIRLVSENLLTRLQRQRYRKIHAKLFQLWDEYEDGNMSTSSLLRNVSHLQGLAPVCENVEDGSED